jgi:hypothetical protein
MRFKRSEGLTPSEQLLADLCDRSFLKLWTYPNLFKKPSKELADLLVVFGNDVIIFSDKSCTFPNTGNPTTDWSRWYRKSIARSAHQVDQAERWIRTYPDNIFLDAKCTERLPITMPPASEMRVHRVCVALGALDRAAAETGARALMVDPRVTGDAAKFTVGAIEGARGWVHVFDEDSLSILLEELSTAANFVQYLNSKVRLLDDNKFRFAASELDIMAYYLWNGGEFPPQNGEYRLEPNLWAQVEASPDFLAGREENKVSQFWDGLIEYVTGHYLSETLQFGNEMEMSEYERLARIMAMETRFSRRILAKAILERAEIARRTAISTLLPSTQPDVNYVLFIGRGDQGGNHEAYRADRALQLKTRCTAAKAVEPEKRYVVGIALDALGVRGSSEDFMLFDTADWTKEDVEKAQKLREELGYFMPGKAVESQIIEDEYPRMRSGVDVSKLADDLSNLTVVEAANLAEMLKEKWAKSEAN